MIQLIAQLLNVDDSQVQLVGAEILISCKTGGEQMRLTGHWAEVTNQWADFYTYLVLIRGEDRTALPLARSLFIRAPEFDPNCEAVNSGRHPD